MWCSKDVFTDGLTRSQHVRYSNKYTSKIYAQSDDQVRFGDLKWLNGHIISLLKGRRNYSSGLIRQELYILG